MNLKEEILKYSFSRKLSHIPSALSMADYVWTLFSANIIVPYEHKIVIGKPFGAQAYYLIWEYLGFLDHIDHLSVGVKHDEIPFVDYSEETIGNALGVAAGIAMTTETRVWVNLSDAALQMGNVLEAIQFIGQHQLKNILVTVDYNSEQVTGNVNDIIAVSPVMRLFSGYNWDVHKVDGHSRTALLTTFRSLDSSKPSVVFCTTKKGHGVPSMIGNPNWHYKTIGSISELEGLLNA